MENFKFYAHIRFKLHVSASDVYSELCQARVEGAPSRRTIFRWFKEFQDTADTDMDEGSNAHKEEASGDEHCRGAGVGRRRTSRTAENIQAVKTFVNDDCHVSVRFLAACLNIGKSTVHEILTQDLALRNVSSVWVPHNLSEENKACRVNCAKQIRRLFFQEGMEAFCDKLVVQDETWVYLKGQQNKQQNRCWLQADQPRPQVVRRSLSDKKVMLLVAFTPSKRFSIMVLPPKQTADADFMIRFVRHTGDLWRCLRTNPIHLNEIWWQWDNARPHKAKRVQDFFNERNIKTVFQSPYSPDLNLCDRFFFQWLKSDFGSSNFQNGEELQRAALQWARELKEEDLHREVQRLVDYCQAVINAGGSYVTA